MLTYYVFSRCRASPKDPLVAISPYTMTVYLSDFYLTSRARGPMPFFHGIVNCDVAAVTADASAATLDYSWHRAGGTRTASLPNLAAAHVAGHRRQ